MSIEELVEKISTQMKTLSPKVRPLLVGIDGLGGAGKSTFVKSLEHELTTTNNKVVTFHLDDHIVERNKRYGTGHEEWVEYYTLQWDVDFLASDLFERLHTQCDTIILPFYNKVTDSISAQQFKVEPNSIILVEGIFLQRPEWKSFFDFVIFLDCPRKLRYKRVLKRDSYIGNQQEIFSKYKRRYWPAEKHYLDSVKPIRNADVVLTVANDGTPY